MKRIERLILIAVSLMLVTASVGCKRKPEDLEKWRHAKGGMERMQKWAQSKDEPRDVRIRAVEILVQDGHPNDLQPTLKGVKDKGMRKAMVEAAMPMVQKMWDKQDMPKLTDAAKQNGGLKVGNSQSVKAKDDAYFLEPFAEGATKKKLQTILADWMSKDWQLRNKLGSTTLGQIAPRAGKKGMQSMLAWLKEAVQPAVVADMIKKQGDDDAKKKAAIILRKRAEKAHPNLDAELEAAVMNFQHPALEPYYKKVINDPNSPPKLIDEAMGAMVKAAGEHAAPFFSDLVKNKSGQLRWVSATRLVDVMGKAAFTYVGMGLPVEMDSYPGVDATDLKENVQYFCRMYQGAMKDAGVSSVDDQFARGLKSSRWPARVLALQCAGIFKTTKLKDQIAKLQSDKQKIPGWGKQTSVGDIAKDVLEELSKT